ncbi:MAG: gliding motility-associated C-terminal domain-containing protein [Bacteroidales bacterium]|nr:gliding motility-associated C-terminal domain-containing protein [Bacteroidales bacterium]
MFNKILIALFLCVILPFNLFSQGYPLKSENRAPIAYNINTTLGGDNIPASLKIAIIGDNLQIYRNVGSNDWDYQYYNWSDHPGRGIHLYIDGEYYYVDYATKIFVNGVPSGTNLSYFDGSSGEVYDTLEITKIDNYNATVRIVETGVVEAFLRINYPAESDYINYTWEITNMSSITMNDLRFFQAGDTYSYGSDMGYGYWDGPSNTVGCQKEDNGEIVSVFLQSIEIPYQHESANYGFSSGVESHVMNNALTGNVLSYVHDNAIALEWRKSNLAPGETFVIHTIEKYSDKDITDLVVTAPLNESIYQGQTKNIVFNVRNNSVHTVSDIILSEVVNLAGWIVDVISHPAPFELLAGEEVEVTVEVFCPLGEAPGTIAKATLEATADTETANDKAYIIVLSNLPGFSGQPHDDLVCSTTDAATFGVVSNNADAFQWQINSGSWTDISDGGVFSGATTDTLSISSVAGLINFEFRCLITNSYGDAISNVVSINPDGIAPGPNSSNLPAIIEQCSATLTPPLATDNCLGPITGTTSDPMTYSTQGNFIVNWVYEDDFGNSVTQTQLVIIDDTNVPSRDNPILPTLTGDCSFTITDFPTATDNCAGVITGTTTDPLTYDSSGVYNITWVYDDGNGNVGTQIQQVIIDDQDLPVLDSVSLQDIEAQCEVLSINPPTATDGCSGKIIGTTDTPFPINQTTVVEWDFEDENGNIITQNQNVFINDIENPVLDQSSLPTISETCSATITNIPTATDNCLGQILGTTTDTLFYDVNGVYQITWVFDDTHGNSITQTQTVIIDDTIAPILNQAVLPTINDACSVTITNIPTATDNCEGQIFGTTTDPLYYETDGSYTIHWFFVDNNGHSVEQEQTVIVSNENPVVETQDLTFTIVVSSTGYDVVTIKPQDIDFGSSDDCGIDSMLLDKTIFTTDDEGENPVNLTVIDVFGNSSSKSAIVTIILDYLPEFPNLITPDGNGKNDYWVVNGIRDLEGYTLTIYNKLGEIVFQTDDYDNSWNATYNGQELPGGTYYYIFSYGRSTSYSGFISVVR